MGWKSTIDVSREEAKRAIMARLDLLNGKSNKELADMMEGIGYGDDANLMYFGHDFIVVGDDEECVGN
jgi:hypothetical protein